jgi:hypothetical protein
MKVLKNFNNISEQLREECIPEFKQGMVKTFRMLNGVVNNNPDITQRLITPIFYRDSQIRTYDRIRDPFLNDGKGGYVDIGVVENFDIHTEQPTKFKLVVRGQGIGYFLLDGGSIDDAELYEFLCICNENGKFKYRDSRVTPLFEEVTEVDGNEKEQSDFDLLLEAGSALRKCNPDQKKQLSILLHIDPSLDNKTLNNKLNELVKARPQDILNALKEVKLKSKRSYNRKEADLVE